MIAIERMLRTGYAVLRVTTVEEDGAVAAVTAASQSVLGAEVVVHEWDAAVADPPDGPPGSGLGMVLEAAAVEPGPAVFILRDVHHRLDDAATVRRLRRLPLAIGRRPVRVVLLTPPFDLPVDLIHDVPTATFALPSAAFLQRIVDEELPDAAATGLAPALAAALRGLTTVQARLTLRQARVEGLTGDALKSRLFEAKAARVREVALQFFPPEIGFEDIGGLQGLKRWASTRARDLVDLSPTADPPRGILLTGVSGCGKSYAIKALSRALEVPLFRLDMARVFAHRQPESAYAAAIAAIELVAPCVLWLDEIENALALGAQDSGPAARIAGSFLTWLQERPPGVFVGATANRVDLLPAELVRRGRFDQILFVDLPDDEERKAIWSIQLRQQGLDSGHFDLILLARATNGWSGAEIAAVVESARIEAAATSTQVTRDGLFRSIGQTVPLSVTMQEQIKRIREWAHKRAILASGKSW